MGRSAKIRHRRRRRDKLSRDRFMREWDRYTALLAFERFRDTKAGFNFWMRNE